MNFLQTFFQKIKSRPLLFILLLSLVIRVLYLMLNFPLWWDSHVYIGMGKYLFSGGQLGIWESFRPLSYPLLLGSIWKLGFDPLFMGKILDVVFSLLAIYLTYLIGKRIFNKRIALIGSLLFSLTPVFLKFTGLVLSEPLALVFGLLGIHLFLKKKLFFSGFFLSLSFLTKFPQGIFFGIIFLILLCQRKKLTKKITKLILISIGFILPLVPYFIFNYQHYPNLFEPFLAGSWIVTTATWYYGTGVFYYFFHFFAPNPLYLFFFSYCYRFFQFRYFKSQSRSIIFFISLATIIYFIYVPRKEPRYLVTIIPFISLMVAFNLVKIHSQLKRKKSPLVRPKSFLIICVLLALITIPDALYIERIPSFEQEALQIIRDQQLTGTILSSNPTLISYLDQPVIPLYGLEFASTIYEEQKEQYQLFYLNDCDFLCSSEDSACQEKKEQFLTKVEQENEQVFKREVYLKKRATTCTHQIYLPR